MLAGRLHHGCVRFFLVLFAATILVTADFPAEAQSPEPALDFSAEQVLEFADHLFSQREYFRAIGEYQRFLFLYPDNSEAPTAAFRISQSYFRGKSWQQALEAADAFLDDYSQSPLKWQARLLKARALTELGRSEEARGEFMAIIEAEPDRPFVAGAWYFIGLSYAREGRWLEADEALAQITSENLLYGKAGEVKKIVAEASERKLKNPAVAGLLAIIPGAGHLYCGRPGDAALAFVFTGAFAWATVEAFNNDNDGLGIGLGVITLALYGGNIFSAVNVAHKYNDREERRLQERLAPYEQIGSNRNKPPVASLALKYFF
ncbi:MAG: tetratricopeptide repeat protein [Syntrophobacterales bacterium]|jgi:hypothetical protein